MHIKINILYIYNYKCICDLIYYYTFRYFYNKMNNIHIYDLELLPMIKCNMNKLCEIYIKNWMKYMDIPV